VGQFQHESNPASRLNSECYRTAWPVTIIAHITDHAQKGNIHRVPQKGRHHTRGDGGILAVSWLCLCAAVYGVIKNNIKE